jgi:pimeloyl-ACP methyl ester carboxylesterase
MNAMQSFTTDIGGPVFVADYGGSGMPAVLVHGLGGSHINWAAVGPELARSFHVLAPDLPGFGRSPSAGREASIAANVRVIEELIRRLDAGPVLLMGNSMGGLISLGVAAGRSDLLSGLVLVDAALPVPREELFRFNPVALRFVAAFAVPRLGEYFLSRAAGTVGAEGLVRSTLARCTVDWRRVDPRLVQEMIDLERERLARPRWHEAVIEGTRSIVQTLMARRHVERWIRAVSAPTLLVHGARDGVVRVSSARAASDMRPDWEYVELGDAGHVPMMEVPRLFLDTVDDWLESVPPLASLSTRRADSAASA